MEMEATDMRSLSREARHERRMPVIRLRGAGHTCEVIAPHTGLRRTGEFDNRQQPAAGGANALRDAILANAYIKPPVTLAVRARTRLQVVKATPRHLSSTRKHPEPVRRYC